MELAAAIAVRTVRETRAIAAPGVDEVRFWLFDERAHDAFATTLG